MDNKIHGQGKQPMDIENIFIPLDLMKSKHKLSLIGLYVIGVIISIYTGFLMFGVDEGLLRIFGISKGVIVLFGFLLMMLGILLTRVLCLVFAAIISIDSKIK